MLEYLSKETQLQVLKNNLYIENEYKVLPSQRNLLFQIIMKSGKVPKITNTGFILYKVE